MQGRFGKFVLAVLGVVLMLVFILPSGLQNMANSDATLGTLGGQDVRGSAVNGAADLYAYATRDIQVEAEPNGRYVPLTATFGSYAQTLEEDPELFYLLLEEARANGATMPPEPVLAQLTELNAAVYVPDRNATDGRKLVKFRNITGEQLRAQVLEAAGAILSVRNSLEKFADYPRFSRPVLDYFLATRAQKVDLRTVVFDAAQFLDRVEAPTEEAMREQFEKYKDNLAGATADEDNPFGFGYRLPDRVKFQYITIPGSAVRQRVLEELSAMGLQERERVLYRYWHENRARFPVPPGSPATQPVTQPSTQPSTGPSTAPGTQPGAQDADAAQPAAAIMTAEFSQPTTQPATGPTTEPTTGPTTGSAAQEGLLLAAQNPQVKQFLDAQTAQIAGRPNQADWRAFVAVHDGVAEAYLRGRTQELKTNIGTRMREIVGGDYRPFDLARSAPVAPAGAPGTQASAVRTRAGVPVDDPAYFEQFADRLAEQFGVRPNVVSHAREHLSREQLADAAVVGPIADAFAMQLQAPFGDYLLLAALPLIEEPRQREQIEQAGFGLRLYEPSQPLMDLAGNEFVFRVTDALPDAPAKELVEVADQVREDLRKQAAYELALAQARTFAEQARQTSLDEAAGPAPSGYAIHDPEPFVPAQGLLDAPAFGEAETNAALTPAARGDLAQSIYEMLADPSAAGQERPIAVLQMRPAFRAVVAELQGLEGDWTDEQTLSLRRDRLRAEFYQQSLMDSAPGADFFDFDKAAARVGYVRARPRDKAND